MRAVVAAAVFPLAGVGTVKAEDVLACLDAVKRAGPGWMARCPAHEDRTPSLSVSEGREGVLLTCHAGCPTEKVVAAIGLDMRDLFHEPKRNGSGPDSGIEATYDYVDEDGNLLFQVVRKRPKGFSQRQPDGRGGWVWHVRGVRRVLYRLPQLIEAAALGKPIYVVEGEKDVGAMESLGAVATCNPMGAGNGKWRDEYSETLRGAHVRIIADKDEEGRAHAERIAEALDGIAASVEILEAKEGKDPQDHVQAGHGLEDFVPVGTAGGKIPAPTGVGELLAMEEPEETYLVEELMEADANILLAAAPKSHKTNFALHVAVSSVAGRSVLGAFRVPEPLKVGLVLMEDRPYRVRRRIERIAHSEGIDPDALDGRLFLWFRPPLRLGDLEAIGELARYVEALDLDMLWIDSYSYVSVGDSNSADEVTPQLMALSSLRHGRPGLTVGLIVHAGKHQEHRGDRVTDIIRGSGAFGAWYDTGILLSRKDEHAPVTMRVEHRALPAPEPFAFTVTDEYPGTPPAGYLRLRRSGKTAEQLLREEEGARLAPELKARLAEHPEGVSRRGLRDLLPDEAHRDVEAAFDVLRERGEATLTPPPKKGLASTYQLTVTGVT